MSSISSKKIKYLVTIIGETLYAGQAYHFDFESYLRFDVGENFKYQFSSEFNQRSWNIKKMESSEVGKIKLLVI